MPVSLEGKTREKKITMSNHYVQIDTRQLIHMFDLAEQDFSDVAASDIRWAIMFSPFKDDVNFQLYANDHSDSAFSIAALTVYHTGSNKLYCREPGSDEAKLKVDSDSLDLSVQESVAETIHAVDLYLAHAKAEELKAEELKGMDDDTWSRYNESMRKIWGMKVDSDSTPAQPFNVLDKALDRVDRIVDDIWGKADKIMGRYL